tara:strand:+ start:3808 stop:4545 length:738 start_codon:yes stop_codon:yes gene_type:complete
MARISTYVNQEVVKADDKWIGTDASFLNATKNFTAQSVADFLNLDVRIQLDVPRFYYQIIDPNVPGQTTRNSGSISFDPPQAADYPFSSVSGFRLSNAQVGHPLVDIASWYTSPLIGSSVIISKCADISQWGIFKWISSTQNGASPSFYDIVLNHVASNGSLEHNQDYFISLLDYGSNTPGDLNEVVNLTPSAAVFVVSHNLGKYPAVSIIDGTSETIICEVVYDSLNVCTLTFNEQFTGKAIFN